MSNAALLVEDNTSHAELISEELESVLVGWTLDVAPTLAEARRRMATRRYDLLVLDFRLPDGDGIQLLREVRASGVDVPALFVTTASSAKLAVEAMKVGADDYAVKEEGYLAVLPYMVREVLARRQMHLERKALQERLHRAERAATLGYLASGLAHHINNPLATIRTFLQLLPARYDDEEFRTGYLQIALQESERIQRLVKDIMRAATVPAGAHEIGSVEEILVRAEEGVSNDLQAKELTCRKDIPDGLPTVRVHGEAATCLLLTLLQNAVRFSPAKGEIEIVVRADEAAGRVVVSITDQGPGIPAEHRTKIFEPFFTTAVDGLGMGLFVAARIADLQNLELSVAERAEAGASFRVGLPIAVQPDSVAPTGEDDKSARSFL